MKFIGSAYVYLSASGSYLCLDTEDRKGVVLKLANPGDAGELQELGDALNEWADKEPMEVKLAEQSATSPVPKGEGPGTPKLGSE